MAQRGTGERSSIPLARYSEQRAPLRCHIRASPTSSCIFDGGSNRPPVWQLRLAAHVHTRLSRGLPAGSAVRASRKDGLQAQAPERPGPVFITGGKILLHAGARCAQPPALPSAAPFSGLSPPPASPPAQAMQSNEMEPFFPLSEQFTTQEEPTYCALGTLTMCMNALGVDPHRRWRDATGPGWRWWADEMFAPESSCLPSLESVRRVRVGLEFGLGFGLGLGLGLG